MSSLKSKSKSVVITGASTGIGEYTAKLFAKKGWTVFAGVRKQVDAERLRNEDPNIKPLILDVTKEEQIKEAFEEVRVAVGSDGLDALVSNAGTAFLGPVEFMSMKEVVQQFDLNVFGVIRVTQAALPLLRIGSPGRIVSVGSVGAEITFPYGGMYCGTKGALDCISECLRREVAKWGIKVSVLKPGPVKSKFKDTAATQINQVMEALPKGSKGYEFYGKNVEGLLDAMNKAQRAGTAEPSASSAVIYNIVTSRSPRNFYWDTWGTWITTVIYAWLPTWLQDYSLNSSLNSQ